MATDATKLIRFAGLDKINEIFDRLPDVIMGELTKQIEKEAEKIVALMEQDKPVGIDGKPIEKLEIGWTWGDAPRGSVTVGRVANNEYGKVGVTVYARGATDSGFGAAWFEFGTRERFHESGKSTGVLPAQPFFWKSYRARRQRLKPNFRSAITRGVNKAKSG